MSNTVITANLLQKEVMRKLRKTAVLWQTLPNKKYEGQLKKFGQTVEIQGIPKFVLQHGGNAGADITGQDTTMTSETITVDQVIQDNRKILDIEQIRANTDLFGLFTTEMAKALALDFDSSIATIGAANANTSNIGDNLDPQTVAKTDVDSYLEKLQVLLRNQNAGDDAFCFVNPTISSLIRQSGVYEGFKEGLDVIEKAKVGWFAGFKILETTNLPEKRKLTVAAVSTGNGTYVINVPNPETGSDDTVTFTAKATPNAAGEFDVAGSAGAQQTIIRDMINGTGTCGATSYIALSAADRAILDRGMVYCGAFASNAAGVFGRRGCTFSETDNVNNLFGTAGTIILAADKLAVNFILQEDGFKVVRGDTNNAGFYANILMEKVYKTAVLTENAKRIAIQDVTNGATS